MLVLLFVALWFVLRGDLFYVFPCVILFLWFSVLLALGKRELILVLFVRLLDLCLFGFVGFLFLLMSGKGVGFMIVALPGFFSYLFFYSIDRSIAVVPVLVFLTFCYFVVYSTGDLFHVLPCVILFLRFSVLLANLSDLRTFVQFVLVWICRFLLPLGVWEGLRLVIVTLPELFSYIFLLILPC